MLTKLRLIAALACFSLSGAANAMLPMMFLMMGGGMMQGMGSHGDSSKGVSRGSGHDHDGNKETSGAEGAAARVEPRHDSATGTAGAVGAAGISQPPAARIGGGSVQCASHVPGNDHAADTQANGAGGTDRTSGEGAGSVRMNSDDGAQRRH